MLNDANLCGTVTYIYVWGICLSSNDTCCLVPKKSRGKATNTTNISCLLQTYPYFSGKLVFRFFFWGGGPYDLTTWSGQDWPWVGGSSSDLWCVQCPSVDSTRSRSHMSIFFGLSWEGSREANLGKRILGMQVIVLVVCNIYAKRDTTLERNSNHLLIHTWG